MTVANRASISAAPRRSRAASERLAGEPATPGRGRRPGAHHGKANASTLLVDTTATYCLPLTW